MAQVRCLCPPVAGEPRHPDGDTITLRERLDLHGSLTAKAAIALAQEEWAGTAETLAYLTESYTVCGIESWTLVDAKGKPLPVTRENIHELLLSDVDAATIVADEADDLYRAAVILPLVARASNSSRPTPTPASTSRTNGSGRKHPKPSKRSSTTTTPTAGTATTT